MLVGDKLKKNKLLIKMVNLIVNFRYIFLIIFIFLTILLGFNNNTNYIIENKNYNDINKIEIFIENINIENNNIIINNINNIDYVRNIVTDYKDNNALLILYVDNSNKIKKDISIPIITNITKDNYELLRSDLDKDKIYYLITNKDIDVLKQKPIIKE